MSLRLALVAAIAPLACGGQPHPAPSAIAHRSTAPAAPTCADVGVILRGPLENASDTAEAGRTREAAIANACEIDRWTSAVIDCVATKPKPTVCLERLTEDQRASYDDKLAAWNDRWGGDSYGGETYGADTINDGAPDVACADAVAHAGDFPPRLDVTGDDHTWGATMRERALQELCERDDWDNSIKMCLQRPTDPGGYQDCLDQLGLDVRDRVTARVTEVDRVVAKVVDAKKQPKKITCDKAVAVHYADAKWKDKLDWIKGKDRTKMIAESRSRMKKACVADGWNDTLRACVTLDGGDDCFTASAVTVWSFPAPGVAISTGIPECDTWGGAVNKLASCDKIPQGDREALQQAYINLAQQVGRMPKDQRAQMGEACNAATDAVKQIAASCP